MTSLCMQRLRECYKPDVNFNTIAARVKTGASLLSYENSTLPRSDLWNTTIAGSCKQRFEVPSWLHSPVSIYSSDGMHSHKSSVSAKRKSLASAETIGLHGSREQRDGTGQTRTLPARVLRRVSLHCNLRVSRGNKLA